MEDKKTLILTGANGQIGRSILKKFSTNHYKIYACTKSKNQDFINFCREIEKNHKSEIVNIFFDFNNTTELLKGAETILNYNDKIDLLINNAGILKTSPFLMTKIDDIKNLFEVNFFSQLKFTQIILKNMIKNKAGNIINVSSTSGIVGNEGRMAYSATKSSLNIFSKVLSKELAPFNIRVNAIAPGLVNSNMLNQNTKKEVIEEIVNNIPSRRLAETSEIAEVVFFLGSNHSSYINGQVISVDGGLT
tara:strand:- start:3312 stop:4055 length:744 start_codon:yes stop_codon:yes gene_type:complete